MGGRNLGQDSSSKNYLIISICYKYLFLKIAKADLICEKILDFLNALPYIFPEILFGVPLLYGATISWYLARLARLRERTDVIEF